MYVYLEHAVASPQFYLNYRMQKVSHAPCNPQQGRSTPGSKAVAGTRHFFTRWLGVNFASPGQARLPSGHNGTLLVYRSATGRATARKA
jgi:hypothetical protein